MRLRRTIGLTVIETTSDGYRLAVDRDDTDATAFEHLMHTPFRAEAPSPLCVPFSTCVYASSTRRTSCAQVACSGGR